MLLWRKEKKEQARTAKILRIEGNRCVLRDAAGRDFIADLTDARRVGDQVSVLGGKVIGAAAKIARAKVFKV